uniref:Uncharacterized protein n=1 Tax=Globodera rostochiensis TaxID=31243 RepID=A0A914IEN2_GLORO
MIGPKNELQTFLTAYKCSSKDQSKTPPIIYSFGHSTGEIVAISLNKNISTESKQNFNFLLKLSEIELTPFDILILAKEIEFDLHSNFAGPNIKDIYYLVLDHFYRFGPISEFYKVEFKVEHYCNLVNFMLQLMNRVKESPNLSEYFVNAEFSTELEQKFSPFCGGCPCELEPIQRTINYIKNVQIRLFILKLWQDLVNEGQETEEDQLMAIERKGTENDDKNAFGLIVTLNDELEKAKTFCIEKI